MKRIGLVGCGAIGRALARAIARGAVPGRLAAVCDADPAAAARLARGIRPRPAILPLRALVARCDVVVECASAAAAPGVVAAARARGRDVLALSVAGLLHHPELLRPAARGRMVVPSGALGALDALRASRRGGLRRVTLTSSKPPRAWAGAPHILRRGIRLDRVRARTVLFAGDAAAAARGFPANINIAATVALAGLGARRTRVRIVADPALRRNVHHLEFEGAFGRASCRFENVPFPENPKTSRLAALSALEALAGLLTSVRVGG